MTPFKNISTYRADTIEPKSHAHFFSCGIVPFKRLFPIVRFFILLAVCGCQRSADVPRAKLHPEASRPADDLRLLTGRAGIIFKGVASEIKYETDEKNNLPYTYVTFRQIEALKDITGKFKEGHKEKIVIRNFGGLREDGKVFEMSHLPEFFLGGVYLVFYTAGEWDNTPVVGGDKGAFRVVKSRTLGYEMLIDYTDQVVVGVEGDSIRTFPLKGASYSPMEEPRESGAKQSRQGQFKLNERSPYSEENVQKMIQEDEAPKGENESDDSTKKGRDSARIKELTSLPAKPMSLKEFTDVVLETDRKYKQDFAESYSRVLFEGKLIDKERTPQAPKRQQ